MEESETLALVMWVSRAVGLAPYHSLQRLRVSRRAVLYSYMVHFAVVITTFSVHARVKEGWDIDKHEYRALLWTGNIIFQEIILWFAVIKGSQRVHDTLFLLARVEKICRSLKYNLTMNATRKMRLIFIFMALTISVPVLFSVQAILMNSEKENISEFFLYGLMLFDIKDSLLLLWTTQFVFMAMKINSTLLGVNKGLEQLYIEMRPEGDLEKYCFLVPRNPKSGALFIDVKPKMVATFNHRTAHLRLRSFADAYTSTCHLARMLSGATGIQLFQLLAFTISNLLQGIYYFIKCSGSANTTNLNNIFELSKSITYCLLHISKVFMLVVPGHDLSEELENTRFLVSHISCEASSCSDAFRTELDVFLVHLKVDQPCYNALGMCTVGRPLLLTVAAFVVTYLAVLLGI